MTSALDKVRAIAAERTGRSIEDIDASTELRDLGDSLDLLDVIVAIDKEFEAEIEPAAIAKSQTIADLAAAVSLAKEPASRA